MKLFCRLFLSEKLKNNDDQRPQVLQCSKMKKQRSMLFPLVIISWGIILYLFCTGSMATRKTKSKPIADIGYLLTNKDLQAFGEKLFFDKSLSAPEGQSCAVCHGPEVGWTGPDEQVNKTGGVYPGAMHERYGNRKPNSSAYASLSPAFHAAVQEDGKLIFAAGRFPDRNAPVCNVR